jgi:hypothetical protein
MASSKCRLDFNFRGFFSIPIEKCRKKGGDERVVEGDVVD